MENKMVTVLTTTKQTNLAHVKFFLVSD